MDGTLTTVTGKIYENGIIRATYTANEGEASKTTEALKLSGQVTVVSVDPVATLRCNQLAWNPQSKTLQASGGVTIEGAWGTYQPGGDIWASPDLSKIATPDLFRKP
ncbi:MAG: LPS export ABC transporter periplasmic protein LptC [Fimbriimonas sp.]